MYQNRVSIIGFVGNDAQLRSTKTGASMAVFSVATKSSWKNASGSYDSRTDWHRCVVLGVALPVRGQTRERGSLIITFR